MKKILYIALVIMFVGLGGLTVKAGLYDFYTTRGLELPSVSERAPLAEICGIKDYSGDRGQNIQLESCLDSMPEFYSNTQYWVNRIKNNDINPLTEEELSLVPDKAWNQLVPRIIRILPNPNDDDWFGANAEYKELSCIGSECDKYFNMEGPLGFTVVTGYKTTLRSSMTATQSTVPVSSMKTKDDTPVTLTATALDNKIYIAIEPGGNKEEITLCTDSTATSWTSCTRGLAFSGTSTASVVANAKTHNSNSIVVISNVHYVYDELQDKTSDETIGGLKTYTTLPRIPETTPTDNSEVASWAVISNLVNQGATTSTESVAGISELATQIEMASSTDNGINDPLVLQAKYATSTPQVRGLYVPITENDGYLNQDWLDLAEDFAWSGNHTFTGNVTTINATSTSFFANTVSTTALFVSSTNMGQLVDGSNADSLHTHITGGAKLEMDTTQITISNSTTETSLGSFTLTGGLLSTNNGVVINIPVSQAKLTISDGATLVIKLKYGATTITSFTLSINPSGGSQINEVEGYIKATILASGATNTQKGIIEMMALSQDYERDNFSGTVVNQLNKGTSAEDSSGDLTVEVTAKFSSANAQNNMTTEAFIATYIK